MLLAEPGHCGTASQKGCVGEGNPAKAGKEPLTSVVAVHPLETRGEAFQSILKVWRKNNAEIR